MSFKVLFIGKKSDFYCEKAIDFICNNFNAKVYLLEKGESLKDEVYNWEGDYIISYLSPYIIPDKLLRRAKISSINFHPAPPEYPGIGCTNFAIYNNEKQYGVTCHHMIEKVDEGPIIAVKKFSVSQEETVYSLTQKSYSHMISLFYEIMEILIKESKLPVYNEQWKKKPYTRRELNELCQISVNMSSEEIKKRIRAVTFPEAPGAYIVIDDCRFYFKEY